MHLVNPSVPHAVKAVDAFEEYLEPHNLLDNNYLIFPINDSNEVLSKESGTHWGMLVYSKNDINFY